MPRKINVPLPNKGLVVDRPGEFIDSRAMSNCQNIQVSRNLVEQRNGAGQLGTAMSEQIIGMRELEEGINTYLVRVGTTKAELYSKSLDSWSDITGTALTGVADDVISFAFPVLSGARIMTFTNNNDAPQKYTGSGTCADLGGSPPDCKFMLDFGGYLVLANVTTGGVNYFARVQWSDTGDPETWSGGNSGSTDLLEDSLPITGLARYGNAIAIHKETSIILGQLVESSSVFRFTRKETGSGTIAHNAIQNLPDGTQIFLARDGIRLFNGFTTELIPSPVIDELRDSMAPQYAHLSQSVLVKDLDEVWFAIPIGSQTTPETVYKYNYRTGQVYKDPRTNLTTMCLSKIDSDETWDEDSDTWDSDTSKWDSVLELALHRAVVFGDSAGIVSRRSSASNDISTAIDSIMDTKDFTVDDVAQGENYGTLVRWLSMDLWAKGDTVTVWYSTDSGSTWNRIEKVSLTSDYPPDDSPDILYFDVISSKIRFRFRNQIAGESWTLKKYSVENVTRGIRK